MSRLGNRVEKLKSRSHSNAPIYRLVTFDDTREDVEKQIAKEEAVTEANGEHLMAVIVVPHKGGTTNEFRKANGLTPLDIPGCDEPRK